MEMPTCTHGTCPGHKADDLLPFEGLMTNQDGLFSNEGFYKLTSPDNDEVPYVYDSLSYWAGCTDASMMVTYQLIESQKGGQSGGGGGPDIPDGMDAGADGMV